MISISLLYLESKYNKLFGTIYFFSALVKNLVPLCMSEYARIKSRKKFFGLNPNVSSLKTILQKIENMGEKSDNFKYVYVGQPPNQPRKSNFVPKRGKVGTASIVDIECLESGRLIAGNLETLKKYDIKDSSSTEKEEEEESSILKAGQVVIAAKPFVFAPSTGYVNCTFHHTEFDEITNYESTKMVFCYQNCSDLL